MRPFRPLVLAAVAATSLGLALPASAAPPAAAAGGSVGDHGRPDRCARRGEARPQRTQKKVDSRLLTEATQRAGQAAAVGVGRLSTGVTTDKQGMTAVDVLGNAKAVSSAVGAVGGRVVATSAQETQSALSVPLAAVESLAAKPGVDHVDVASQAMLANADGRVAPASKAKLAAAHRQRAGRPRQPAAAAPRVPWPRNVGTVTSEGDRAHGADAARAKFRVTGTGVTVGVLSDGVDSLAASIASGDLPADTRVLPGQEGSGDEGTAMLEIVHDLAPNAHLVFATAFTSEQSFADNIRGAAGRGRRHHRRRRRLLRRVAVPGQRPGPGRHRRDQRRRALLQLRRQRAERRRRHRRQLGGRLRRLRPDDRQVRRRGARLGSGPAAPRRSTRSPTTRRACRRSCSGTTRRATPATTTTCTRSAPTAPCSAFSNDTQDGNDLPFEGFNLPSGTVGLAVVKFSGADRYFQLTPFRGRFEDRPGLTAFNTPGVTRGHSAVPAAFSVAAVPAAAAFPREIAPGVPNPAGPFPNQYTRDAAVGDVHLRRPAPGLLQPGRHGDHPGQPHLDRRHRPAEAGHHRRRRREHLGARLPPVLRHLGGGPARGRDRRADPLRQPGHQPGRGPHGADQHRDRHRGPRLRPRHRLRHRDAGAGAARTGATPQPLAVADDPVVTTDHRRRRVRRAGRVGDGHDPGHQPG